MFPEIEINIEAEEAIEEELLSPEIGRTPLYDFEKKQYVLKDGKVVECSQEEAVRQWIGFLVKTAADKFDVYRDTEFGTYIENYIGFKDIGFVSSEIERELTERLPDNRAISSILEFETERDRNRLIVHVTVELKNGSEVVTDVEI